MKVGFCSDTGQVRSINEDTVLIDEELGLFVVADGMGGHQAGEVASRMAVDELRSVVAEGFTKDGAEDPVKDLPGLVLSGFYRANQVVKDQAGKSSSDMATTMTAALTKGDLLVLGHIGDSRAYRLRSDSVEQLTDDHSLVAELVRRGVLTEEQASNHPRKNVVLRAIGVEAEEFISDVRTLRLEEGDRIFLCSDGLTNVLPVEEIRTLINNHAEPAGAARALVEAVNARGAPDNVTVVILQGPWTKSREPTKRKSRKFGLGMCLALAGVLLLGAVTLARSCYYLGVAGSRIAVYRGIPGGPSLIAPRDPLKVTTISLADCLPPYRVRLQHGIPVRSYQDAIQRIAQMQPANSNSTRNTQLASPVAVGTTPTRPQLPR